MTYVLNFDHFVILNSLDIWQVIRDPSSHFVLLKDLVGTFFTSILFLKIILTCLALYFN